MLLIFDYIVVFQSTSVFISHITCSVYISLEDIDHGEGLFSLTFDLITLY